MIICNKCNTQLPDDSRFCYNCGTPVKESLHIPDVAPNLQPSINQEPAGYQDSISEQAASMGQISDIEPLPTIAFEEDTVPLTSVADIIDSEPMNSQVSMMESIPQQPIPQQQIPQQPIPQQPILQQPTAPIPYQEQNVQVSLPNPSPVPNQGQAQTPYSNPYPMPIYPQVSAQSKKPGSKLPFILIGVAGALVFVILLAFLVPKVISNFTKAPQGIVYLKDEGISYTSSSKIKTKEITDNVYDGGTYDGSYSVSQYISFSEDGKTMFYPEDITDSSSGVSIYYCKVNSKKAEGKKIDSEITSYVINQRGTKVVYLKGSENNLYVSNLNDKDRIDRNVSEFFIDGQGNKIIYLTADGIIYSKVGDKDKVKLDSNVTALNYVSADLKTIYYVKNKSLYVKTGDKDEQKIDSDISDVVKIYNSGEIYYLKSTDVQMKLSEFVNDDLAASDAAMEAPTEPVYPDYYSYKPTDYPTEPSYWDYSDSWGYIDWDSYYNAYDEYSAKVDELNKQWEDAYNAAIDQYNKDYETYTQKSNEYYEKQNRDSLRESLGTEAVTLTKYSLYYYAAGTSKKITDSYNTYLSADYNNPVLIYENRKDAKFSKINMSEVTSYDDVYNFATTATASTTEVNVAVKSTASKLDKDNANSFTFSNDGKKIYFCVGDSDVNKTKDLYSVDISGTKLLAPKSVKSGINYYQLQGYKDTLVYLKNVENYNGDLYLGDKKIDSDVYVYSAFEIGDSGSYIYDTDYDQSTYTYTLKIYDGKNSSKVANDVCSYDIINDKRIVYLADYDTQNQTGDIFLYHGSKNNKLVDEDVTALLQVHNNYYWGGNSKEEY